MAKKYNPSLQFSNSTMFTISQMRKLNSPLSNTESCATQFSGYSDVMGIIIAAGEIRESGNNKMQAFTLINTERIAITLRVWDPITTAEQGTLQAAVQNKSVIIGKRLRASTLKGITVSTKNSSSITINPPAEAARQLKSWFDSVRETELSTFCADNSINLSIQLVRSGSMKVHTIPQIQNATECRDYWVKGFLQLADEHKKFYYTGCSNCFSKIKVAEGTPYPCWLCNKEAVASLRPIVAMTITDTINSIKAVAVENTAERILQSTATDIARMTKLGEPYETASIEADLKNKTYMLLIRQTYARKQEHKRLLLITYFENGDSYTGAPQIESPGESPSKGKSAELSLSPLKRQLNEI